VNQFKPSYTAQLIARSMVLVSKSSHLYPLVDQKTVELNKHFLKHSMKHHFFIRNINSRWYQSLLRLKESVFAPGIVFHLALRKKIIEQEIRSLLAQGSKQVLILGAGFDSLAIRLHSEYPEVQFIEIDQAAGQNLKLKALTGLDNKPNLRFINLDLNHSSLTPFLENNPKTVILAEGLFMYLSESVIKKLISEISASGSDHHLIFSYFDINRLFSSGSKLQKSILRYVLKFKKESLKWVTNETALKELLTDCDMELEKIIIPSECKSSYLSCTVEDQPIQTGEHLCLCRVKVH